VGALTAEHRGPVAVAVRAQHSTGACRARRPGAGSPHRSATDRRTTAAAVRSNFSVLRTIPAPAGPPTDRASVLAWLIAVNGSRYPLAKDVITPAASAACATRRRSVRAWSGIELIFLRYRVCSRALFSRTTRGRYVVQPTLSWRPDSGSTARRTPTTSISDQHQVIFMYSRNVRSSASATSGQRSIVRSRRWPARPASCAHRVRQHHRHQERNSIIE